MSVRKRSCPAVSCFRNAVTREDVSALCCSPAWASRRRAARRCEGTSASDAERAVEETVTHPDRQFPPLVPALDDLYLEVHADGGCAQCPFAASARASERDIPPGARGAGGRGEGRDAPEVSSGERNVSSVKRSRRDDLPTDDAPTGWRESSRKRRGEGRVGVSGARAGHGRSVPALVRSYGQSTAVSDALCTGNVPLVPAAHASDDCRPDGDPASSATRAGTHR